MGYKDIIWIKQMIANGVISQEIAEKYIPELKESEDERIRKAIICGMHALKDQKKTCFASIPIDDVIAWLEKQGKNNMGISEATKQELEDNLNKALEKETPESCNEFLEKQGEQKHADKVEPKFHEGEWVTDGTSVFQIVKIESEWYIADDGERVCFDVVHQYYHLWTIQDAKDGDMLAVTMYPEGIWVGIFKENNGCTFSSYCFVNTEGTFKLGTYNHGNGKAIYPATKEQRDLLFQKMKEKGYEWDAEKKELKKIEQNLVDKVEPKFHEGEWVACKGLNTARIINIDDDKYEVEFIDGSKGFPHIDYVDRFFHLWTIQDAKVGDILFQDLMDGMTFIFDGVNPEMVILYSFIINNDGEDVLPYDIGKPNTGIGDIEENKNIIHPATKEQCDLLFQRMHDAGYEWDAEKKELKNIEYEIEFPFGAKDSELQEVTYYIPKGFHAEIDDDKVVIKKGEKPTKWSEEDEKMCQETIDWFEKKCFPYALESENPAIESIKWLKTFKDRVQLQPKQEWSEMDENRMNNLCYFLEKYGHQYYWNLMLQDTISWFKSLKDRYTWKPSDEQINALEYYIYSTSPTATITKGTIYGNLMVELLEQLKKLKGE